MNGASWRIRKKSVPCLLAGGLWVVVVLAAASRADEHWPRWRGPGGTGVSSATDLPERWSRTTHVRWQVDVPGEGSASPIVWGSRVFLTFAGDEGTRRVLRCLDRRTGRTLWDGALRDDNPEITSALTGHAAATPVTDGRLVVAMFGNAGVVCYDIEGRQRWHRDFGEFESELGLASSPILVDNLVVLVCDHDGSRFKTFDSFLIGLDKRTGETVWKTDRRGLYRSWSTPIVVTTDAGARELAVNAQDALRGYDPDSGRHLWTVRGMTGWVTPSPVAGGRLLFACSGRNGPTLAVRPGGRGDVTATHQVWRDARGAPYVCSPLYHDGRLYVPNEAGLLSCFDAASGRRLYQQRLGGKFYASPVAGDGRLYWTSEAGTTSVVRLGDTFELLARNPLDEECLASPAIAGPELLIRTLTRLYCITTDDRETREGRRGL